MGSVNPTCPRCGYSGYNRVYHWGTGEIECENCGHDYVPGKEPPKSHDSKYGKPSGPVKPKGNSASLLSDDSFKAEKVKPIDIRESFSSPSFMAKNGHAEFTTEYELRDWREDDSFKFPVPKYF